MLNRALLNGVPSWLLTSAASLDADFANGRLFCRGGGSSLDTFFTTTRAGVKWVPNAAGVLVPIAANRLPRTDIGCVPEEARTNLFLQSDSLSNVAWQSGGANPPIVSTNNIAPDGSATAVRFTMGSAGAAATRQAVTVTNTQPVVISVYAKRAPSASATNFRICTNNGGAWNTGGDVVVALTDTWQRVTLTYQNTFGVGVAAYFGAQKSDISVDATCQGDVLIWGADFNANNSIPLSHITTTTVAVTRPIDLVTAPLGSWFNPAAGTFIVQHRPLVPNTANAPLAGFIKDATNAIYPFLATNANLQFFSKAANVIQYSTACGALTNGTLHKVAMAYGTTPDFGAVNNGNTQSLAQAGIPAGLTTLVIGSGSPFGGDTTINSPITRFTYIPFRLSNSQVQALTR